MFKENTFVFYTVSVCTYKTSGNQKSTFYSARCVWTKNVKKQYFSKCKAENSYTKAKRKALKTVVYLRLSTPAHCLHVWNCNDWKIL